MFNPVGGEEEIGKGEKVGERKERVRERKRTEWKCEFKYSSGSMIFLWILVCKLSI